MSPLPTVAVSKATRTPSVFDAQQTTVCPNCGTLQSGRRSCCARGGTWFDNCGSSNDGKFAHTWFEGIQACKNSSSSLSGELQSHSMLHENTTIDQQVQDHKHLDSDSAGGDSRGDVATNSKCYDGLANIVVFISLLLLISLHTNMI